MSRTSKRKLSVDGQSRALNDAFTDLSSSGLPEGKMEAQVPKTPAANKTKSKGRVEVRREKAGRGGKTVTTLREFPSHVPLATLEAMTFDLKKTCACGGTLKGRVIELQGDVCERVCNELSARGYQAVRAGG